VRGAHAADDVSASVRTRMPRSATTSRKRFVSLSRTQRDRQPNTVWPARLAPQARTALAPTGFRAASRYLRFMTERRFTVDHSADAAYFSVARTIGAGESVENVLVERAQGTIV